MIIPFGSMALRLALHKVSFHSSPGPFPVKPFETHGARHEAAMALILLTIALHNIFLTT